MTDSIWTPLMLTMIAGLSTGIGSIIAVVKRKPGNMFFSVSLGFSAGIIVFVSLVELYGSARNSLAEIMNADTAYMITVLSFFAGISVIAVIDMLIPEPENPHEFKIADLRRTGHSQDFEKYASLNRMGLMMALAIGIHNFPEGFATFMAGTADTSIALSVTLAIALHNIPEGIAVAVPVYFATGSRKKAFFWSFVSGLAEPAGGLLGYMVFSGFESSMVIGITFAMVAGIMVYIAIDELLPSAEKYGMHHHTIIGFTAGMFLMAVSLMIFSVMN